ncbi:GMC oxidoreductase [Trametes versicolor FP-101664 SS1]|uniref:GMC oxidoreductase n=1 Tax=Trametes versicolor (strain FP-101664) TaxID=717944 RepID=UPI000462459F|nr:GMC oxidoreductase [Trametes versicolor FP-101664 SS1]EIW60103.1 GMC oxidoreductase [Trametes versicolor FP-101664 SS1]
MTSPATAEVFASTTFDYIIVGGGTTGLVLAARLSEDPAVTVGAIEAGEWHRGVEGISVPGLCGSLIGNPQYDWSFSSDPQKHVNDRSIFQPRGKALGGSSMVSKPECSHRASAREYDALETLGNPGWNWAEFLKYMKKAETTIPLSSDVRPEYGIPATQRDEWHGNSGPVVKSYPTNFNTLHIHITDALETLGVPKNPEPSNGINVGSVTTFAAVDPRTATRSYSANAYFEPNAGRKNLVVTTGSSVSRIIFRPESSPLLATGVEFIHGDSTFTAMARKEVILCAGVFQSPQLLELSGIGKGDILNKYGIKILLDLPGVGENLRVIMIHEIDPKYETVDFLQDPEESKLQQELYKAQKGYLSSALATVLGFVPAKALASDDQVRKWKEMGENAILAAPPGVKKQLELQMKWLDDETSAEAELIPFPGFFLPCGLKPEPNTRYSSVLATTMHPLSRGSVHIVSADPKHPPAIDPNYFANPVDLEMMLALIKFTLKLYQTTPLCDVVRKQVAPSPEQSATDEALVKYIKDNCNTVYHPIGSAAMLPREDGGVVSPDLRVYGTANLRVVRLLTFISIGMSD